MARKASVIRDIRANALDKEAESSKMAKVYTTAKINLILEDIKKGKKPDLTPFYHGKKDLRDCNITFERTEEEDMEYKKCAMDCLYFVKNYVKFRNDKGFTLVKLRDYQEDVLHMFSDEIWDEELQDVRMKNRRNILLQSRQTGKCFDLSQFVEIKDEFCIYSQINKEKYNLSKFIWQKLKKCVNAVVKSLQQRVTKLNIVHHIVEEKQLDKNEQNQIIRMQQ